MEFKLILKKLNGTLTSKEKEDFDAWHKASAKHRSYFHHIKEEFQKGHFEQPLSQPAWKKINRKLFAPSRKHITWVAAAAAVAIAIVLIPFFTNHTKTSNVEVTTVNTAQELPGGVLIIDETGQQKVLKKGEAVAGDYYKANAEALSLAEEKERKTDEKLHIGRSKMNSVIVPRGFQFKVDLADGSRVWLNADTKISFPSTFSGRKNREVHVEYGEAYFEVTSSKENGGKKFIVTSQDQQIEVLGTKFNLNAYPENQNLATTLVEGLVNITAGEAATRLVPGEQALVSKQEQSIAVQKVDVWNAISWKKGQFTFQHKPLREIMMVLSRWYDVDVTFDDKTLQKIKFNGALNKNQPLEEILTIFENTEKAVFELNGSLIIIKNKK